MQKILRDNLILRSLGVGVQSDADDLPQFFEDVYTAEGDPVAAGLAVWVNDLITGHPTTTKDDIWVVVDPTENDKIVSALMLIPQTWRYESIEFPVGRVELVATDKDYRRRGLVRELMDVAHQRSADLGHIVQGITGIPFFYRKFGYTMAVNLESGAGVPLNAIPSRKPDQESDFILLPATSNDIPFIMQCDANLSKQSLVSAVRDAEMWEYQLSGQHEKSVQYSDFLIIQAADGTSVGFLWLYHEPWDKYLYCNAYAVADHSSYLATYEDVIRGLKSHVQATYREKPPSIVIFDSGTPKVLDLLVDRTTTAYMREHLYTWYIRVPSLAAFIKQIKPVLEERLQGSGANQFSGTLSIDFYERIGLRMTFENGLLVDAVDASATDENWNPDAAFHWHLFLNVVFGHNDYFDLRQIFPDTWANRKAVVLLDILFPKKRSWLVGIS